MFSSDVAREIDRLVVGGHEAAGTYPDKPPLVAAFAGQLGLLNSLAVVLLDRPVTREQLGLVLGYAPAHLVDMLVDDNVAHGALRRDGDDLVLTDDGGPLAEAVVALQERAIADLWAGAPEAVDTAREVAGRVTELAAGLEPPCTPGAYAVFAGTWHRPSAPAEALRLLTAIRYWRMDAHRRALQDAGLSPREAHALNVLWDRHRGVTRAGQGFGEPGRTGTADLEARGLAADGAITAAGVTLREDVERATDTYTEPLYDGLDDESRERFLSALRALPSP